MVLDAVTENGAPSHSSTMDARLDLFVKTVRDVEDECLLELVDRSWEVDPLDTLKILFNWRDCRGGKGDYRGFLVAMVHVLTKGEAWFLANFKAIPEYGSWLDLVKLWHMVDEVAKGEIMACIREQIELDVLLLKEKQSISLLAKWMPTEGCKWDRGGEKADRGGEGQERGPSFVAEFCKFKIKKAFYRKELLTPLRAHLKLVETRLCAKQFDQIDYESVPSVAMKKYRKAFLRNDKAGFEDYLAQVTKGTKTIKAGQVYPHDLVRHYLGGGAFDAVIEEQWKAIKAGVDECGAFEGAVCVCDVSGSMDGVPLQVCIALGLLGLSPGGCAREQVITFDSRPALHKISSAESLEEQVRVLSQIPWGGNTNFEKTMDLVLTLEGIKRVFVFSDMQFDQAFCGVSGYGAASHFDLARAKFEAAGRPMPEIVFWNLRGNTSDFPVTTDDRGVVMLAGYSPALLGALTSGGELSPLTMMLGIIRGARYEKIKKPENLL
jgi:hypothetical protein